MPLSHETDRERSRKRRRVDESYKRAQKKTRAEHRQDERVRVPSGAHLQDAPSLSQDDHPPTSSHIDTSPQHNATSPNPSCSSHSVVSVSPTLSLPLAPANVDWC